MIGKHFMTPSCNEKNNLTRHELKDKLAFFIDFLMNNDRPALHEERDMNIENFPSRLQELIELAKLRQSKQKELQEAPLP